MTTQKQISNIKDTEEQKTDKKVRIFGVVRKGIRASYIPLPLYFQLRGLNITSTERTKQS